MRCLPAAWCNLYGGWKLADDGESEGGELASMEAHIMLAPNTCRAHLEAAIQHGKSISTNSCDLTNSSFLYKHKHQIHAEALDSHCNLLVLYLRCTTSWHKGKRVAESRLSSEFPKHSLNTRPKHCLSIYTFNCLPFRSPCHFNYVST